MEAIATFGTVVFFAGGMHSLEIYAVDRVFDTLRGAIFSPHFTIPMGRL